MKCSGALCNQLKQFLTIIQVEKSSLFHFCDVLKEAKKPLLKQTENSLTNMIAKTDIDALKI